MKISRLIVLAAFVFSSLGVSANEGKRSKMEIVPEKIINELGLTDVQKQRVEAWRMSNRAQMESLMTRKEAAFEAFKNALGADAPESQLRSLHQKIHDVKNEMGDAKFESFLELRKILTPVQRKQLAELKAKHKEDKESERDED